MPRSNPYTASFNAGELSPRLWARTDFQKYSKGLETCENLIPLAEGGLMRRPGSRYVAGNSDAAVSSRLRPFKFSETDACIIELGKEVIRFFRHQGQMVTDTVGAVIANGGFDTDASGWSSVGGAVAEWDATNKALHLSWVLNTVSIAEQSVTTSSPGVEHVLRFRVIGPAGSFVRVSAGSPTSASGSGAVTPYTYYQVGYHAISFTPAVSPFYVQFERDNTCCTDHVFIDDVAILDGAALEIGSPYAEADLPLIRGPQSADVLYLFHTDYPTYKLERFGNSDWSLVEVAWSDGPWLDENITTTTLNPSATGTGTAGELTITASDVVGINDGQGFLATDIGRLVRISNPATGIDWSFARIVGFLNNLNVLAWVNITTDRVFGQAATASTAWMLGAWSETTGYPSGGAFYEQRLFSARSTDQPQTFWSSNTADFENMAPDSANASGKWDGTVEDDDALNYTLSADDVNAIFWMTANENTLVLGTSSGEWVPESQGAVLTPTDLVVRRQTSRGSANIAPVRIDNAVLFVQRAKRRVQEFTFDFNTNGYKAADMTRLAQHISKSTDRKGIAELAYAEDPHGIVWAVRSDGVLLAMVYKRDEDVVNWSRHPIGGTDAVVESVAVIPGADGAGQVQSSEDRDEVWIIVKRTINGQTARYIEVLEGDYEHGDPQEDAYYADSCITYDGPALSTIPGYDHLEGETVKVYADGAVASDATVVSGSITLEQAASVVQVGLGYTHTAKSLKIEGGTAAGTAVGKKKRISGVTLVLLDCATVGIGPDEDSLTTKDFRTVSDDVDAAIPLFTGEDFQEFKGDWARDPRIVFQSDAPTPFNLLAVAPEINVNEVK